MRIWNRYKLYKQRKKTLNYLADLYMYEKQVQALEATRAEPFNPQQTFPPAPVTSITTEPDPALAASVEQLNRELALEEASLPNAGSSRSARMDAIKRKAGA